MRSSAATVGLIVLYKSKAVQIVACFADSKLAGKISAKNRQYCGEMDFIGWFGIEKLGKLEWFYHRLFYYSKDDNFFMVVICYICYLALKKFLKV